MNSVQFTHDGRPHGYRSVFINPDEVSHFTDSGDMSNPTTITMKTGDRFTVDEWSSQVAQKLAGKTPQTKR